MAGISDADKLGMAALIASTEDNKQRVNREKKADPLGPIMSREEKERQESESILDEINKAKPIRKANGGMVRGDGASRVKTKGKMC